MTDPGDRRAQRQPIVPGYAKPVKHFQVTVTNAAKTLATLIGVTFASLALKTGQLPNTVYIMSEGVDIRFRDDPVAAPIAHVETQAGDGTHDEIQTVTITGAYGGTFTLIFGGQSTAPLAYNASAAVVQAALRALSTINGANVTVAGADGGPYTVEFVAAMGLLAQPLLRSDPTLLLTSVAPTAAVGYPIYAKSEYGYTGDLEAIKLISTGADTTTDLYFVYA